MLAPHAGGQVGSHQRRGTSWTVGRYYDVRGRKNAPKEGNYRGKFRKELRWIERKELKKLMRALRSSWRPVI
jgi:hypothetical protein